MAKPIKLYWDSCAWLGLLNGEPDKRRELEIVYDQAKTGKFQIWTSTLALVEVRRLKSEEGKSKPLIPENLKAIEALFSQVFVFPIPLDVEIAAGSRAIFRETAGLSKFQDAVHIVSATKWNIETLHTYDRDDLLHLSDNFACKNGQKLRICYPDETTDGPLFAGAKKP